MKTLKFSDKDSWLFARRGKITGTRLKDIVVKRGTGKKIGFYELIAERIATEPDSGESPMDRGNRLEPEVLERFNKETKKKTKKDGHILWERDDNESIAISPDGIISATEALEIKCLSSARHIEAWLTQSVPDDFYFQTLQYFIVNDKLKTLYVAFYDPRIPVKDFFVLTIKRKEVEEQVKEYLEYQRNTLKEIDEVVNQLTNF